MKLKAYFTYYGIANIGILCFAHSAGKAKSMCKANWPSLDVLEYLEIRAIRAPEMDCIANHKDGKPWSADCNGDLPYGFSYWSRSESELMEMDAIWS